MANAIRNTTLAMLFTLGCQGAFAAQDNDDFVEDASANGKLPSI